MIGRHKAFSYSGAVFSDVGISREVNQDRAVFETFSLSGASMAVGAICDGVGGSDHGEIAAEIVTEGLRAWFSETTSWADPANVDEALLAGHLHDAAEEWNGRVLRYYREHGVRTQSTMSVLLLLRDRYRVLHVGDSRIYLYRRGLKLLTEDETVVGVIGGKKRNLLNNYIGKEENVSCYTAEGKLRRGDVFFFCSDGFYHLFGKKDAQNIVHALHKDETPASLCEKWVREMETRGDRDNISLGIVLVT